MVAKRGMRVFKPTANPPKLWRLSPELWRPRPRAFVEWSTMRRWNELPYWELDSNPTVEFVRRWSVACGRPITIRCNV